MRKRRVEVACLLRDSFPLLGRQVVERPHVVKAVRKLDEDDARILRDREEQLSVVLDLPFLRRVERQVSDLREPVDDLRNLGSEHLLDLRDRDVGVLDDVVNQPACNCY